MRKRPGILLGLALLSTLPLRATEYAGAVTSKVVLKTTATVTGDRIAYPKTGEAEVTATRVEIAPGAETGWHRHLVPVYAWVTAGTLTVDYEGGTSAVVKAGDALVEAVGTAHNGRNAGSEPVRLLVFYTGVVGTPNVEKSARPVPSPR